MFHMFATEPLLIDSLVEWLHGESRQFWQASPKFSRRCVHNRLMDRAYIGERECKGQ